MKNLFVVLAVSGFWQFASATPIACGTDETEYQVLVKSDRRFATVKQNGKSVEFGDLYCQNIDSQGSFMSCYSGGVVDAGYFARVFGKTWHEATMELYRTSFAGSALITILPCEEAQD